jgi:hypothetical protein
MEFEVKAGAKFDLVTPKELAAELAAAQANWWSEAQRGDKRRRVLMQATVAASGAIEFGTDPRSPVGPREGFVWSVRRLFHSNADKTLDLFVNANLPGSIVGRFPTARYWSFNPGELVLSGGDLLVAAGTGWTAGEIHTVTGEVRELPAALAWRIGG